MKKRVYLNEQDLHRMVMSVINEMIDEGWNGIEDVDPSAGDLESAAYAKGFRYVAFHNSLNDNLIFFDVRESGTHFGSKKAADDRGLLRTDDPDFESYFDDPDDFDEDNTGHTKKYFLKIDKPYVVEKDFDWEGKNLYDGMSEDEVERWKEDLSVEHYMERNGFKFLNDDDSYNSIEAMLKQKGYDCVVYKNQEEDAGSYSVAMFNVNNIKLAEPTYDDGGRPIPLDKRFNTGTNDVRY